MLFLYIASLSPNLSRKLFQPKSLLTWQLNSFIINQYNIYDLYNQNNLIELVLEIFKT